MKVGKMSNRRILRQVVLIALCISAGWFLKTRLTPQSMMGAAGMA